MKLREILDRACQTAMKQKADNVRGHTDPAEQALRPVVVAYRGAERVGLGACLRVDRDDALTVAGGMAIGFDADGLVLVVDSWQVATPTNPVTGRPWEQGEMADVVDNHDGLAKGWVHEGLFLTAVNRAGDMCSTALRYTITTGAFGTRELNWKRTDIDEGTAEGLVPRALHAAMNRPSMGTTLAANRLHPAEFGLGEEEARAIQDCVTVRAISERMNAEDQPRVGFLLSAEPGSPRARILAQQFPAAQVLGGENG